MQKIKGATAKRIIETDKITKEGSVLRKLWKNITFEQYDVWKTKRQIIFGPYGSGKTELIQCKAADLANSDEKVLIILPTDQLITKYLTFFKKFVDKSKVEKIEKAVGEDEEVNTKTIIQQEEQKWSGPHGRIMLLPLEIFIKNFWLYKKLAQTSNIFFDEMLLSPFGLWSPNPDQIIESIRAVVQGTQHVWIVPHLYAILACLITEPLDKEIELLIFLTKHITITTLTTTMRITKQIHDFIIQKEWQDFQIYKLSDNQLNELFTTYPHNKIFKSVLCNSQGHHITGPPVRILYVNSALKDPFNLRMFNYFLHSAAVITMIHVAMLCDRYKFNLQDIAVVIDIFFPGLDYKDIKESFVDSTGSDVFCTFDEQNEGENRIAICDPKDIASFEWPVVIHVKYNYYWTSCNEVTFLESWYNMIASRCTVQYCIICCEPKEVAWPQKKSFQRFNLWCEKNAKRQIFFIFN